MNPKLNILARQLARTGGTPETADSATSRIMMSYKAEVDRDSEAAIKKIADKLAAVQAENANLMAQLSEASKDSTQKQKTLAYKMDDMKSVAAQEKEALGIKHYGEMGSLHQQLDSLRAQLSTECQGKARAEAERDAAKLMCEQLRGMVEKLQSAKPVTAAPIPEKKPVAFETKVTRRDENGHIVSTLTTPQY